MTLLGILGIFQDHPSDWMTVREAMTLFLEEGNPHHSRSYANYRKKIYNLFIRGNLDRRKRKGYKANEYRFIKVMEWLI